MGDEQPQHPSPRGTGPDPPFLVGIEPHREEFGQGGAFVVEDPERAVPGPRHLAGLIDQVPKQDRQLEVRLEQKRRLEHPAELDGIFDRPEWHRPPA